VSIFEYIIQLEANIPASPHIRSRSVESRRFSDRRGRVKITIVFEDSSQLVLAQVIDLEQADPIGKYAYHYQDCGGGLIFRYDNKQHYPDLPTYPDHKHQPDDILAVRRPMIPDVIAEVLARFSS